jgi:hypothetical protein
MSVRVCIAQLFFLEQCIAELDNKIEEPTVVGWALKILWCLSEGPSNCHSGHYIIPAHAMDKLAGARCHECWNFFILFLFILRKYNLAKLTYHHREP